MQFINDSRSQLPQDDSRDSPAVAAMPKGGQQRGLGRRSASELSDVTQGSDGGEEEEEEEPVAARDLRGAGSKPSAAYPSSNHRPVMKQRDVYESEQLRMGLSDDSSREAEDDGSDQAQSPSQLDHKKLPRAHSESQDDDQYADDFEEQASPLKSAAQKAPPAVISVPSVTVAPAAPPAAASGGLSHVEQIMQRWYSKDSDFLKMSTDYGQPAAAEAEVDAEEQNESSQGAALANISNNLGLLNRDEPPEMWADDQAEPQSERGASPDVAAVPAQVSLSRCCCLLVLS